MENGQQGEPKTRHLRNLISAETRRRHTKILEGQRTHPGLQWRGDRDVRLLVRKKLFHGPPHPVAGEGVTVVPCTAHGIDKIRSQDRMASPRRAQKLYFLRVSCLAKAFAAERNVRRVRGGRRFSAEQARELGFPSTAPRSRSWGRVEIRAFSQIPG